MQDEAIAATESFLSVRNPIALVVALLFVVVSFEVISIVYYH